MKYNNKPEIFNGIRFDSKLEADVYRALLTLYTSDEIKVHHKVPLLPGNDDFAPLDWKIDFYIPSDGIYIEAKGEFLLSRDDRFRYNLRLIRALRPHFFSRIIVVSSGRFKYSNKRNTITIGDLVAHLQKVKSAYV